MTMRPRSFLTVLLCVCVFMVMVPVPCVVGAASGDANWPQFRGPGGLGIAPDDKSYPTELDPARNLLWKTEVPPGNSSPCIWGDRIFITARSGPSLETICIDRDSGAIKWRRAVEPDAFERISTYNSHATPTPVCDGKRVYVYFGSFGLLAYDMDGNESWRKPLPDPAIQYGTAASPVLAGDMVVVSCDSGNEAYVLAVDRNTGQTVWRHEGEPGRPGWATPVAWNRGGELELIVQRTGNVTSYNLKDGHKRWWFDFAKSSMFNCALTPIYAGDTLFFAAPVGRTGDPVNPIELPDFQELLEHYDSDGDGRLSQAELPDDLALIYRTGPESFGVKQRFAQIDTDQDGYLSEAEWNSIVKQIRETPPVQMDTLYAVRAGRQGEIDRTDVKWTVHEGIGQVSSPLVYRGQVYLVKHGGHITCYNAEAGRRIYADRVGPRTYHFASPVAADGKVYFCSLNGFVIVVDAGDTFTVLAENQIRGARIYATPALMDGKFYLRTDNHLYAFFDAGDASDRSAGDIAATEDRSLPMTLYEAAASGDVEMVKSLVDGGADLNAPNEWGWTPLYAAVATGRGAIVSFLIAHGAHVDASDAAGSTPLQLAVSTGHKDIFELLVQNGADINAKGNDDTTPLHTAAEQGDAEIVALLIERDADVNAKTTYGWTPLHSACQRGNKEIVVMLIDKGADVTATASSGLTSLHYAAWLGQKDIAELLIDSN